MEILLAGICFFVAVIVGGWRSYCIFWGTNLRTNCPMGWHRDWIRFGSMLFVFLTSLWFSFVGAGLVTSKGYELDWWITFSFLFLSRWLISKVLGHSKAKKEYNTFLRRVNLEGGSWHS